MWLGFAAFLGSVTQTLIVTKKRLQEAIEGASAEADAPPPEVQQRLTALTTLSAETDALRAAVAAEAAAARTLLYVERTLGEQLYTMGVLRTPLPLVAVCSPCCPTAS